jgi:hypothetical protein
VVKTDQQTPASGGPKIAYHDISSLAATVTLMLIAGPQPSVATSSVLEPRLGIQALMLNCVLYDATCMKAPVTHLQPPVPTPMASPRVAPGLGLPLTDPETTGSVRPR